MDIDPDPPVPSAGDTFISGTVAAFPFTESQARVQLGLTLKQIYSLYEKNEDVSLAMKELVETSIIWLKQFPKLASEKFDSGDRIDEDDEEEDLEFPIVFMFYGEAPLEKLRVVYDLFPDPSMCPKGRLGVSPIYHYLRPPSAELNEFVLFLSESLPYFIASSRDIKDSRFKAALFKISKAKEPFLLQEAIRHSLERLSASDLLHNSYHMRQLCQLAWFAKCSDDTLKLLCQKINLLSEGERKFPIPIQGLCGSCFTFQSEESKNEYLTEMRDALFSSSQTIYDSFFESWTKKSWMKGIDKVHLLINRNDIQREAESNLVLKMLVTCEVDNIHLEDDSGYSLQDSFIREVAVALARRSFPIPRISMGKSRITSPNTLESLLTTKNGATSVDLKVKFNSPCSSLPQSADSCLESLNISFVEETHETLESFLLFASHMPRLKKLEISTPSTPGRRVQSKVERRDISSTLKRVISSNTQLEELHLYRDDVFVHSAIVVCPLKHNRSLRKLSVNHIDKSSATKLLLAPVLETSNRTLISFETSAFVKQDYDPVETLGEDEVNYYLSLNRFGRKELLDPRLSKPAFVTLLSKAMGICQEGNLATMSRAAQIAGPHGNLMGAESKLIAEKEARYIFGMLLENPRFWANID